MGTCAVTNKQSSQLVGAKGFFSLFRFHDILSTKCFFFTFLLNSFQARFTPFQIKIALRREVNLLLQSAGAHLLITLIGHYSGPSYSYVKGCHIINKVLSTDSFLDWVSTRSLISNTRSPSGPQHCACEMVSSVFYIHKTDCLYLPVSLFHALANRQTNLHQILYRPPHQLRKGS